MIVLGPKDADLNGAPDYWVNGNWRPHTIVNPPTGCAISSCPFDKCDVVFEYDARRNEIAHPGKQGWELSSGSESTWTVDPIRGALRYEITDSIPSFWQRKFREFDKAPDRAVAYSLFMIEQAAKDTPRGGIDFMASVGSSDARARGVRASWTNQWWYRSLNGDDFIPMVQSLSEPRLLNVWHRMALDAELTGPNIPNDNIDRFDGGKTINSLDGHINHDLRHRFGYGETSDRSINAAFGAIDKSDEPLSGWIRNFYASYPGRFLRTGFRAVALGNVTRLRLVLCVDAGPEFNDGSAQFHVHYTSPSLGMSNAVLPEELAAPVSVDFNSGNAGQLVEADVKLDNLKPGEELWFTVERDWQSERDKQQSTVHLLMVIVEDGNP